MTRETLSTLASWIPSVLTLALFLIGLITLILSSLTRRPRVGPRTPFWGRAGVDIKIGDLLSVLPRSGRDVVMPAMANDLSPVGVAKRSFCKGELIHRSEVGPWPEFDGATHTHYIGPVAGARLWAGDMVYVGNDGKVYPIKIGELRYHLPIEKDHGGDRHSAEPPVDSDPEFSEVEKGIIDGLTEYRDHLRETVLCDECEGSGNSMEEAWHSGYVFIECPQCHGIGRISRQ